MQHTAGQCNVGDLAIQADAIFGTSNSGHCNAGNRTIQVIAWNKVQASAMLGTLLYRLMQYLVPAIHYSAMLGIA